MKLVHVAGLLVLTAGCASAAVRPSATSTTSASIPAAVQSEENVAHVGKAQRTDLTDDLTKEPRKFDRRPGGGFSGWK